jgi:hypothetical protein
MSRNVIARSANCSTRGFESPPACRICRLGLLSVVGSMTAQFDLSRLLVAGGVALITAGTALVVRVGRRFATSVITGISGGAFALVLADITSMPIDAPDRYASLRYVMVLAAILIALITFEDGFRSSKSRVPGAGPVRISRHSSCWQEISHRMAAQGF